MFRNYYNCGCRRKVEEATSNVAKAEADSR